MALQSYIKHKKVEPIRNGTNVLNLINRAKLEQKREKRRNIIIAAAAVSALAVSGLIISL